MLSTIVQYEISHTRTKCEHRIYLLYLHHNQSIADAYGSLCKHTSRTFSDKTWVWQCSFETSLVFRCPWRCIGDFRKNRDTYLINSVTKTFGTTLIRVLRITVIHHYETLKYISLNVQHKCHTLDCTYQYYWGTPDEDKSRASQQKRRLPFFIATFRKENIERVSDGDIHWIPWHLFCAARTGQIALKKYTCKYQQTKSAMKYLSRVEFKI